MFEFDQDLYPKFGSLGVLGQTVKTHGGSGTSNLAYGLVAYEFEKIDSSYRSSISVQSSLVIHPINEFGSQEQKDKYLPQLIKGEKIGCFGLTESEAGSDPNSLKTTFVDKDNNLISEINSSKAKEMIEKKIILGGMIPKINNAINIADKVKGSVIISGKKPHAILFELLSDKGSGTLIKK